MEWFFGTLLLGAVVWAWRAANRRDHRPTMDDVVDHTADRQFGVELRTTIRAYDPNKYRFDGLARPEWRIEYADDDGVVTARDIFIHRWNDRGEVTYFECWCFMRDEKRTFRSDRILSARNLDTNRKVKSIRAYLMRN